MNTSPEEHVFDSLPGFVLGSLEADEARRVREHLLGCTLCRSMAASLEGTAAQLAYSAAEEAPPPDLKQRLMRQVRAERGRTTTTRPAPALRWAAAAMAGAALVLAATSMYLWAALRSQQMLTGPQGMKAVALRSTDAAPRASAFIIVGADGLNGAVVVDGLEVLDPDREYQLWLQNEGGIVSGAVFNVDEYGYRGARINAPENLQSYNEVWITIEPAGGSAQPTGPGVLKGTLHAAP